MKKRIQIFSCLLFFVANISAQVTDKMNFQMLLRDASGDLLINSPVGLRFQIFQGSTTGPLLFQETQTTTTNEIGIVSVKIGSENAANNDLTSIEWYTDSYYITIGIDPLGGTNYTLQNSSKLNSVPLAASSLKTVTALSADYNSLTNLPITITTGQIDLLGYLTLTNAIDFDAVRIAVDLNTLKAFPGFGTTVGTAFEILWSKIGTDAFYPNGNVGIGANTNLDTSAALLSVDGGVLYEETTTFATEIGALKYLNNGTATLNDFYFGNNLGNLTLLNSIPNKDIVFASDANILSKLGVGESITPSYNFGNNTVVLASAAPSIRFQDTSSTGTFPSADWSIEINDDVDFGANYFSISNFNTGDSNFKISAGAPSNVFTILENGNVGLNMAIPTTELEVPNTIIATGFTGGVSGLTNLPSGTASTANIGSTTIITDNNSDTIGAVIFQNQNQTQMTIASNGDIAIGNNSPTATLDVDGTLLVTNIKAQDVLINGQITQPITIETPANFTSVDVNGKSVIVMNPITATSYFGLANGIEGQVVTLINTGVSTITFFSGTILTSGGATIVLEQNESLTLVKNGNNFLVMNLVN